MRHSIWPLLVVLIVLTGCPCEGPAPKPTELQYTLVSTTSDWAGTVRITAIVRNVGLAPFISGKGQQAVCLYEDYGFASELVAQKEFLQLDVDATVELTYERPWDLSEEFPPQAYVAQLLYDPDIYEDGNPDNDDCNWNNNELTRSTAGLDDLFGS
jgi:hypothetical protein